MNETSVTVVGNVASDVIRRRVGADDQTLVTFRIMSTERRRDRASDTWVDGDRFSATVSCWRRLGEHVLTSVMKGDPVVVRGRLTVREYEVDGQRRFATEIRADAVGPDLTRCTTVLTRVRAEAQRPHDTTGESGPADAAAPFAVPGVTSGATADAVPPGASLDPWDLAVEEPRTDQGPDAGEALSAVA